MSAAADSEHRRRERSDSVSSVSSTHSSASSSTHSSKSNSRTASVRKPAANPSGAPGWSKKLGADVGKRVPTAVKREKASNDKDFKTGKKKSGSNDSRNYGSDSLTTDSTDEGTMTTQMQTPTNKANNAYSTQAVALARTKFDKRGSFGRFKTVFLELRGFVLLEYSAMSSTNPLKSHALDQAGARVADVGSMVDERNCFMLVTESGSKKDQGTRAFYRAVDDETFELWLTAARRAITAANVAAGRAPSSKAIDVAMFSDPCCVIDLGGTIVEVNQACCDLLGWNAPSDLIGQSNKIMIPAGVAAIHDEEVKRHDRTDSGETLAQAREIDAKRKDGMPVTVLMSLGTIGDAEEKRFVVTMRNITQGIGTSDSISLSRDHVYTDDAEEGDFGNRQLNSAIEGASALLRTKLKALRSHDRKEIADLRAKNARIKARNEMLSDTIAEIDGEVRNLKLTSHIARRALELLISTDTDTALRTDEGDDTILDTLRQAIKDEVRMAQESSAPALFRGESFNTRKISAFMFVVGAQYLNDTLATALGTVRNQTAGLQVDKLEDAQDVDLQRTVAKKLTKQADTIMNAIAASAATCPTVIRDLFRYLRSEVQANFFGDMANPKRLIIGFLFLRFFVPAVTSPTRYGLLPAQEHSAALQNEARLFLILGKLIQYLSIGSVYPGKADDAGAAVLNRFVRQNLKVFPSFVKNICAVTDPSNPS